MTNGPIIPTCQRCAHGLRCNELCRWERPRGLWKRATVAVFALFASTALASAQTPSPRPSAAEQMQALGSKVQQEVSENIQLRATIIEQQAQIADLQKQVADKVKAAQEPAAKK